MASPRKLIGFSGFRMEPYGLQRVEVLKGPPRFSTARTTPAAWSTPITKRPTETPFYDAFGSYGSFDTVDGRLRCRRAGRRGRHMVLSPDRPLPRRLDRDGRFRERPHLHRAGGDMGARCADIADDPGQLPVGPARAARLPSRRGHRLSRRIGALPRSFVAGDADFNRYDAHYGAIGYQFSHEIGEQWTVRQNLRYTRQETDYRDLYYGAFDGGPGHDRRPYHGAHRLHGRETADDLQRRQPGRIRRELRRGRKQGPGRARLHLVVGRRCVPLRRGPPLDILDPDYSIAIPMPDGLPGRHRDGRADRPLRPEPGQDRRAIAGDVRRAPGLGRQRLRGPPRARAPAEQKDSAFTGNVASVISSTAA